MHNHFIGQYIKRKWIFLIVVLVLLTLNVFVWINALW